MTVVVSGATVTAMPSPMIAIGGRNPLQYEVDCPDKAKSAKPTAAIVGPAISGTRAPTRSSRPPDQRDKAPMMIVKYNAYKITLAKNAAERAIRLAARASS